MERIVLEMEFLDQMGRKFTLRVDDPKEDLTATELAKEMNDILVLDVFRNRGIPLESAVEGRKVTTTKETISI